MKFSDVIEQACELLQRQQRLSYRSLKREFDLDEESLDDLKFELVESKRIASDEDGKLLVWVGATSAGSLDEAQRNPGKDHLTPDFIRATSPPSSQSPTPKPPVTYTPAHLADRIRAVAVTDGERKTITALFADLKGSTALIEGLDPEEARTVIDPALQLMMDAVHQYDGFVAQALGDGIFALFGAPLAHEDHPQRALYAALRMQVTMRRYADTLRQKGYPPLLMRVGLNTGEVVLRSIRKDDLHADYVPVGHSTNLAARMEQLATPGSIVVSAHTHRLTDGYFAFKDLGATQIKGATDALNIYELLGLGQLRTRLQVSASRYGLTRFVGRHSEMEQLKKALENAKASQGQIVGAMGEPGLGKSRLFHEFKLLSLGGCLVLEAYSVSHGKATAYLPVIELLKSYFEIKGEDDERKRREKVLGKVLGLDRSLEDTLPYLFALLGIEEQPSPLAQMDPQIRRRRTFEALKKLFLRESLNQPLVLIFEDLHWIDGETQGFLDVLSESLASAKLLLLTNYRPEYRHEWGQKTYYTQLRLAPFGQEEAEEFLDALLGVAVGAGLVPAQAGRPQGSPLQDLKHLILDKTQGTPFFMEEIVQELVEQGVLRQDAAVGWVVTQPTNMLQLPVTVQAVLAARIDRLVPDEKALLQQLAVIGRQFPLSLIRQVITQAEADLYRLLASLQHKEFLYEQPAFPESEYIFKHALTQEVAYGTVLQEQRKALHGRTGQAMEVLYKETLEEHCSALAYHYSQSGNTEKAIEYLQLAGQQALQRSAYTEASAHLHTALGMLQTLPETPDQARHELNVLTTLGAVLIATQGYAAAETGQVYTQARALCQRVGETPQLAQVLWGLAVFQCIRGELRSARELLEQLLDLVQRAHDPAILMVHQVLGYTLWQLGEFESSRAHVEAGINLYDPQLHHALSFLYSDDPGVMCHCHAGRVLWFLGYPDQGRKHMQEALRLARELSHPYSQAQALACAANFHNHRREGLAAQELAEAAMTLCEEEGFLTWLGWGRSSLGHALIEQGRVQEGMAQLQYAMTALHAAGVGGEQSTIRFTGLTNAYRKLGRFEEGLQTLAEALTMVEETEERYYEAELYRLKGELTLQLGTRDLGLETSPPSAQVSSLKSLASSETEAEAYFFKAIEIAQKQQAKSWELRAATSLARLWQRQGKTAEAHDLLAPVYNWFTEGFDTKDLQEAKALLDELT